jgi:hypothetical protein
VHLAFAVIHYEALVTQVETAALASRFLLTLLTISFADDFEILVAVDGSASLSLPLTTGCDFDHVVV